MAEAARRPHNYAATESDTTVTLDSLQPFRDCVFRFVRRSSSEPILFSANQQVASVRGYSPQPEGIVRALFCAVLAPPLALIAAAAELQPNSDVGQPLADHRSDSTSLFPAVRTEPYSRFTFGASIGVSRGYAWGVQVGPYVQYWPTRWLGIQASAAYVNDAYLFFDFYRVHAVDLSTDAVFRFGRFSASAGPVMNYHFAPVVDKRIWGWHAQAGLAVGAIRRTELRVSIGYVNRVDPRLYERARRGFVNWSTFRILLHNIAEPHLMLSLCSKK